MTKFLQLVAAGTALGAIYGLVGLGYVVIYRATGVINFAQGGLVVLGGFLTYNATATWGLGFWPAMLVSMAICALLGVLIERVILRQVTGQPVYVVTLITVGLLLLVEPIVTTIWKNPATNIATPWGLDKITLGDVQINQVDIATLVIAGVLLAAFFLFFRFTKYGVAMRAAAADQEAALMQGISVRAVVAMSWGIAGAVAAVAGTMLGGAAGPGASLGPTLAIVSFTALAAIVLGGLDSPVGAVVGGLIIGIAELLTKGYQKDLVPWLPDGFGPVMPYVVLVLVLLIRPYGLFGTREVQRV